jgi:DNA-binding NarL/FixJ family response regulator
VRGAKALELCAIGADSRLALRKITSLKPDLVVLDLDLLGHGGLDLFKKIKIRHPSQSVVMLSMKHAGQ